RSLPLPAPGSSAVYMLSELGAQPLPGDLIGCLGPPDASFERTIDSSQARQQCGATTGLGLVFDNTVRIDGLRVPETAEAGQSVEARLVWQPLIAHPEPQQTFSLQLDDPDAGDGTLWGNATLDLYPADEWQPGEAVLSRLPMSTDATALPQRY